MQNKSNNLPHFKHKRQTFLSEYQSFDSQSPSYKIKESHSSKLLRRLKQLWNKQKYLTDDEFDSSKDQRGSCILDDSSMEIEPKSSFYDQKAETKIKQQRDVKEMHIKKCLHPRQCSSSDDKWNTIRKSNEVPLYRQENQNTQLPINNQLQQILAFNSEIENQHSN